MPFNDKINLLGKSKTVALKQFFAIEHKMKMKPQFAADYRTYMKEFEASGYMTKIQENEEDGYYTPHHGVYGSSKDKIRIVYNASCKTSTGISLNECQHTGAKLQDDLAIILMRFRTHRVGITADIKAMYCQVNIHPDHRKYQKILWRASPHEPVGVYQLTRVAFGQTAAPFLAIRTMHQCADDYKDFYTDGAKAIKSAFYVDDLLTGADKPSTTVWLTNEINTILQHGQFPLAKWCSNNSSVNKEIGGSSTNVDIKDPEMKTVLGLQWTPTSDLLAFRLLSDHQTSCWTKRLILSEIGKLYDPNGLISPVVIVAKILMQHIWLTKTTWDEPVTPSIIEKWETFRTKIHLVQLIKIPRWLGTGPSLKTELHGFSDASQDAYACCVYARTRQIDGTIKVRLIQSKTRVAPLKTLTIPRLELCGAQLLAKLMKTIIAGIDSHIKQSYCWTDSEVVLQWLKQQPSTWKTFVCNRVAYIQEHCHENGIPWHWVPGPDNPADIASRGQLPDQLAANKLWWNGPEWLSKGKENWPEKTIQTNVSDELQPEARVVTLTTITKPPTLRAKNNTVDLFEAYDNFLTLWHVVAYTHRAIANFKTKDKTKYNHNALSDEELNQARIMIIRDHQHKYMDADLRRLATPLTHAVPNQDHTRWLEPTTGVIRLKGRVTTENLSFDQRTPVIISNEGSLATLLMKYAHEQVGHGGAQQMLHFIRQQYWILKARQLAKTVIHRCNQCRRYHLGTANTLMAQLPKERTTPQRAFKQCGVDYAGPVNISSRRGRAPQITKGYIGVFVCLVTRAIHLEIVSDGTKETFIQALRRFFGRRGTATQMWSDNGTTFVGANNYLRGIGEKHNQWAQDIEHDFHLQWRFIVPRAPSLGGIWEAAVKSVKKHIIRVVGSTNLTYEEWATLLSQVEAWVNSRPLVPLSDDPSDMLALTPGHFLIGESLITLPEPENLLERNENRLTRWELVQKYNQDIWHRWQDEYLSTLIDRTKWKTQHRNFQLNDLVLIREDNMPPSKWHLGRIIQPLPSKDGIVRAAKIRTLTGEYTRAILKLALLKEATEEENKNIRPITERITSNLSQQYDRMIKSTKPTMKA